MVSEHVSESLLHKVCCRVTSCDLMSSDGIDLKADFVTRLDTHRESCILRIQNVEINTVFSAVFVTGSVTGRIEGPMK